MMPVLLNILLALCFASIGVGAFLDGRLQAWPLGLVFGSFAVYSVGRAVALLRKRGRGNGVADGSSDC